jgi:hypothetical protein
MTTHLRRFLVYPLAAALPALGLMLGLGTSAGASTAPRTSQSAAAAAAIKQLVIGQHGTDQKVSATSTKIKGLTQVHSTNWSGYADTGSSFSKVSSSWTEPSATCSSGQEQLAAFWIGIDGYSSSSVEQDGTLIECYQRRAYQYTWWEMYPTNAIQVVGSTVAAGDAITATVTRSGTSYTLTVTDSTHTADSFTTTQSCSNCANSSAEWIAEAPSGSSGVYPLAHFSTWTSNNSSATGGSTAGTISSFTDDEITMVDNSGKVKAQPGGLNSSGNSFSVTWESAT